jgi:hypothetical protein
MSIPTRSLAAAVAVVAVACVAPCASAQSGAFEGVVAYKMAGKGAGAEMTQMYKGTKSRTEINSGGQTTAMIMDMAAGTMMVLMPPQKAYMVMDMKKMEGLAGMFGKGKKDTGAGGGAVSALASIKATGRKDTIAGHACEYYVMGEKGEAEVCSAKGLGMFMMGQSPMGGAMSSLAALAALGTNADAAKMFADGFFPLKVVNTEGGKKEVVIEATRVEKKSLDASLFVPPPDYKEMKMPGFGR